MVTKSRSKTSSKKKVAKKTATKKKAVAGKKTTGKKTAAKKITRGAKKTPQKTTAKKQGIRAKKAGTTKKVSKKIVKKASRKTSKKTAQKKKITRTTARPASHKTVKKTTKKSTTKIAAKPGKKAAKKTPGKSMVGKARARPTTRHDTDRPDVTPYREKSGEDYMNAAQSEHFRHLLNAWKKSLMQEVERTVHHMQDEAANFPDPNDRATQEEEFALELRTRDRERKLIKKINESLLALDSGDYGYCEVCGIEIGVKRLEARPTATLCIDCKTLDEIKEKQLG